MHQDRSEVSCSSVAMEKASGPLPKPAENMEQIHEEPSPDLTAGSGEFAEPVGLPDRIPLVKPYLKKKLIQRKVDTKCLRALDTILSSLLGSDALVGGDGVFVPQTPLRVQRHLCSAAGQKPPGEGGHAPGARLRPRDSYLGTDTGA
ncbi:hypothetical protein MATL_G00242140 [Megalops atlanticus]|uniref:Uncharacterized protein n=1 Tax=Megalops atlanticus TaxID=7932 RepID=A0A9D3PG56_MEGAT|nr:hypothetical protein MATL_G00242140 [Megalops atlanticus]